MSKKKGLISEFKEFISRGSVIDLAVGIIVGSAFTAIVTSLVNDIIMPIIGILFGGIDFTYLKYVITPAVDDTAEAAIYYGNFIQSIVNFLLVAFAIFMMIKAINKFHRREEVEEEEKEEVPERPTEDILLLREIRDLLQKD
ncbi:MAG: large-conductance mechanosensitive channel protein MscL [Firmicutes bacterium]|nr:large-conductance mechanosensitive channel protein MscL [Bacillota bacterium]